MESTGHLIYRAERKDDQLRLVVPEYYGSSLHTEAEYTDGIYGELPSGRVFNFWAGKGYCGNYAEFMYNNPYQPTAETDQKTGKKLPFLDGSGANSIRVIGSMKQIWKQFERDNKLYEKSVNALSVSCLEEEFWQYYYAKYQSRFEDGVKMLQQYIAKRRQAMDCEQKREEQSRLPLVSNEERWQRGCRDFLRHLIYTTPRGYIAELVLLAILSDHCGGKIVESTPADEKNGIDGYIDFGDEKIPVSLKPASYREKTTVSPLCKNMWFTYGKDGNDLIFICRSGENIWAERGLEF